MIEAQNAVFNLVRFTVPNFSYNKFGNEQTPQLKLEFNPSGKYFPKEGRFELHVDFIGFVKGSKKKPVIKMTTVADFKFPTNLPLNEFPSYFWANSIAIIFPYLRSFISTLTLQTNTGVVMLGLINFTNMAGTLLSNTEVIE